MTIAAHFRKSAPEPGKARAPRRTLFLEVQGSLPDGGDTAVYIHNISVTGLLLESEGPLEVGEAIAVDLPHAGMTPAKVVWASEPLYGCQFDSPLAPATLMMAELSSAVANTNMAAPAESRAGAVAAAKPVDNSESFGLRLQRLRKGRKLTQAQVAEAVGVSKPTVWAWEQGRARPVETRLDALAKVLGVDRAALLAKPNIQGMGDMLARSREQIAAAFGTGVENVRIMIEL